MGKTLSRAQKNSKGNSQSKFEREKGLMTLQILAVAKTNQFFSGPCFRNQCTFSVLIQLFLAKSAFGLYTGLKTNKFKLARLSVVQIKKVNLHLPRA